MRTPWQKAMTVTISVIVKAMWPLCVPFPNCNRQIIVAALMVSRPVMVKAVQQFRAKFPSCSQDSFVATPMVVMPNDKLL